jgi:hypothetical protein
MPKRKTQKRRDLKGKRVMLYPFHLQQIYDDQFVRIANQVLQGQLTLLSFRSRLSLEPATCAEVH